MKSKFICNYYVHNSINYTHVQQQQQQQKGNSRHTSLLIRRLKSKFINNFNKLYIQQQQ